ncbi:hypothetical protein BBJ28_00017982 [Nothophytophthora sp. Chile5]|nr:hypothetical protein BBJ28_00017982 [Nothophytophthora sp. Chile5]
MRVLPLSSVVCLVLGLLGSGANTAVATSCSDKVSTGDQSAGISAIEDAACASGGLGCFPEGEQCRFCKVSDSSESSHLLMCTDVQGSKSSSASSSNTESAMQEAMPEATINCASLVSVGDQGVGISATSGATPSCASNGLGCFQSGACRFCQTRTTPQSGAFLKCSDLGVGTSSTTTTTTQAPSTPTSTVASTSTSCATVVQQAGLTGISYVTDSRCNVASPTLPGCTSRSSCRLCRNAKNEANQYLVSCKVLQDQATETSVQTAALQSPDGSNGQSLISAGSDVPAFVMASVGAVALLVVAMVGVMFVKKLRDPALDECLTPDDDGFVGNCMTPHGGHGNTPREGSLVMVVSQSSIVTL